MDRWKSILRKLLFPNTALIFLLVNISAILLVYAFAGEDCPEAVKYISYFISAYALTVVCARMPGIFRNAKQRIYSNQYANKLLTEEELRVRISLYGGLALNVCFALFKAVMGAMYQTNWLYAMAEYNIILSGMTFILVKRDRMERKEEDTYERRLRGLHSYKVCGWLMLLLSGIIIVIVMIVIHENQRIKYPGFMIYAIAAFTFYDLVQATLNMVKNRNRQNPVFSAIKRIELAKGLVSIFTLQVAMLTQFGGTDGMDYRMVNAVTGFTVCIIVISMAVFMLIGVKQDYKSLGEEMR